MGERKVLNKYYPPDFDPAKLPRGKRQQNNEMKVRMMLPMSVRCRTCGTFMYKGTKFNTRKEDVQGETYLGLQIFRFYYRCTNCAAEFTMRTDPKTSDYVLEQGASRNYEPWREADAVKAEAVRSREEEERGNAMKALENRTKDSKREMDIMEALDEMRSLKARHAGITPEQALAALAREGAALQEGDEAGEGGGEDEEAAAAAAAAAGGGGGGEPEDLSDEDRQALQTFLAQRHTIMKRLDSDEGDSDEPEAAAGPAAAGPAGPGPGSSSAGLGVDSSSSRPAAAAAAAKPVAPKPQLRVAVVRPKRAAAGVDAAAAGGGAKKARAGIEQPADVGGGGAGLGLAGYGSSSGDEA